MKNSKFSRKWTKWAVAMMIASLSAGTAVACKGNGKTDPPPPVEVQDPLGVFYFDAGIDEYQLALGANNQVTFTANGESKTGTYKSEGSVVTMKFDDDESECTATIEGDVLSWNYNNQQMRFFKKVFYTVSYDEQGGGEISDVTVVNGKTIAKPADPVREGYEFLGWYVDSDYQTPFMFDTQLITGDVTLFAQWAMVDPSAVAYMVDFDLGYEGDEIPAMETISGKLFNVPDAKREGYKFCGWWISAYENGEKLTYKYTPDTVFTANTTLFAVWESESLGAKLSAPQAEITETGISWDGVQGVSIYRLKVTGPEGFLKIDEDVSATSYAIDFANQPAGDYNVELTAVAPNQNNNSETVKRAYVNKAVGRVSQFSVLDGRVLLFNRVENAENYYITIECGNESHNHDMYNNGDSVYYSFSNCEMTEGGIRFTVTATAEGYASVQSETFVYNCSLDKVEGIKVDEETQMVTWNPVKNATNYIVSVSCGNKAHVHEYVDVGSRTSFSLKECSAVMDGEIKINVFAQTKGYNSPTPTEYSYNKTKLAAPSNVTLTNVDKKYILTWDPITDYDGGAVEYSIKIGNTIVTTTETSYDITEAITWIPEETYMVEVKATSPTNESVWSEAVKVRYYAMSNKMTYKAGVLSWEPVIGATAYEVRVNDGAVQTVSDGSTSINVELTQEGTNYIYVRFVDTTNNYYSPTWATYEITNAMQIIFDGRGSKEDIPTQYKVIGDYLELPTPTREGYEFVAWYNTPKGPESNGAKYESGIFDGNSELVLYAYWTPAAVTLNYANVNMEGKGSIDATSGTAVYTKDYKLDVPVLEDKTMVFLGWFAGMDSSSEQLTDDRGYSLKPWSLTTGATVYAQYVSNVLEFNLLENGTYSVVRGINAAKLTTITIPDTYNSKPVTVVDGYAFRGCSRLVSVNIPDTIEIVSEETAFEGCRKLQEVNVYHIEGNRTAVYSSVDGVLLYRNDKTGANEISFYPKAKIGEYEIPDTVTEIPLRLFEGTQVTQVTIPTSVTVIRSNAFINCSTLERIIFEEGGSNELVIEDGAFRDCTGLKSITLPARLSQLAVNEETHTMDIFAGCTALTHINVERGNAVYASNDGVITDKVGTTLIFCPTARKGSYTIPQGIETIGDYAFVDCKLLTEIVIPGYVENVGAHAFEGCTKVARIRFTGGAVQGMELAIGEYAFANMTALKSIEFAEGSVVSTIGAYAFTGATGLRSLTIPTTMKYIGDYAFEKAESLGTVTFENGEEGSLTFGNYVFSECIGLKTVELPKSVTALNLGVFDGCVNISEIKVDAANANYKDIDGVVFTKDGKELVFFPKGRKGDANGEYVIPEGVEKISEGAFRGMFHIEKIVINNTITEIGKYAFQESMKLKTLEFAADNDDAKLVICDQAFAGCAAITAVKLPARTQKVAAKAFYGVNMTTIEFPANLEEIGDYAFAHTAITSVEIPAGITYFGEGVFDTCVKLAKVTFAEGYQGTSIPYASFQATAITEIEIPASIESIGYAAFNACEKLTKVTFADGGTADLIIGVPSANATATDAIPTGVFMNCKALTSVEIPDRAIIINQFSFSGCEALAKVEINETSKLQRIGKNAFSGCLALSSFYFPNTIQNSEYVDEATSQEYAIGEYAFYNTGLTSVTFAKGGTGDLSIGKGAFAGCGARTLIGQGKEGPIYEYVYLSTIDLPNRIAPIYRVEMDGNVAMLSHMVDGINADVFSGQGFTALTAINIEDGGQYYGSKDGVLYRLAERNGDYVMDTLMLIPIQSQAIITIPYTVSTIGVAETNADDVVVQTDHSGMVARTLTTVQFEATPEGQEDVPLNIGRHAFYNVTTLTKFEFPERLVGIYGGAFQSTRLTEVHLPANLEIFDTDGNGSMQNGSHFKGISTLKTLTFAKGIKIDTIPYSAFESCTQLKTIEIPANVRTIGANAFKSCPVTSLTFEDGCNLTTIGNNAFYGFQLTELSLPENVTTLDGKVFQSMSKLEKLILPASFTSFTTLGNSNQNNYLFNGLSKLKYVQIHEDNPSFKDIDGVVYTKDGTELVYFPKYYYGTTKYEYVIPAGVQSISTYAFYQQTYLTKLTIPADVKYINYQAFYGCTQLTTIVFEEREAPLSLGDGAFQSCSRLNGVSKTMEDGTTKKVFEIPESVRFEGGNVFYGCFNKSYANNVYIVFLGDNESNSFNSTFASCTGIVGVENLPTSVASMNQTFKGCTGLKSVTFRDDDRGMIAVMNGTFYGCKALTSIDLPNVGAFSSANNMSDGIYHETGSDYAGTFQGCTALHTVTMKSANVFGVSMFKGCTSLKNVTMPDGLASIQDGAFYGCSALENVTIPGTVETIGTYAFKGCTKLQAIEIPTFVSMVAKSAFENCTSMKNVTIGAGVLTIQENAFRNVASATEIVLPNAVETIEPYAFYGCASLKTINIPASVRTIGEYAFANCTAVETVSAADGLEVLGDYAFAGFAKAKSFNIPATLVSLGIGVFDGWSSLESLTANGNLDYAYLDGVLYNATYTKIIFVSSDTKGEFVIPETITAISEGLFANTGITSIVLPDTIREIPARTFLNCRDLVSVTMPSALERIGDRAFEGCTSLKTITIPKTVHSSYEKLWNVAANGDEMANGYYVAEAYDGIGHGAFMNCTALETVIFEEGGAKRLSIGDFAFYGCTSLKGTLNKATGEYEFVIPSRVRGDGIPKEVYSAPGHEGSGEGHQRSEQGIGMYAFARSGLENVVFEDETTIIMAEKLIISIGAFQECASLKSVTFGNTLGNIELVKTMPKGAPMVASIAAIAENAFYGCRALTTVTFPKDTSKIYVANGAFEGTQARVEGVMMVDGSIGVDYGDGKAMWNNGDLRVFGIDGCGICSSSTCPYQPHSGIFYNDVPWAEDFR